MDFGDLIVAFLSGILIGVILGIMTVVGDAHADDTQMFLSGGVGVFHSAEKGLSENKFLAIGLQDTLVGPLKNRYSVGGWLDNGGNGRKSSAYVCDQIGFEVNNNGFVGNVFTGPSLITSPDNVLLGSPLEFQDTAGLGLQDAHENYYGVRYTHFSDAGLTPVNIGRDSVGLELRWKF